jgi:molecular chaperone DnaK
LKSRLDQLQSLLLELGTAVYQSTPKSAPAYGPAPTVAEAIPNHGAASKNGGTWDLDNEVTLVGDIDETVITDYEAVD